MGKKIVHVVVGLNIGGAELMLKRLVLNSHKNGKFEHFIISLTDEGVIGLDLKSQGIKVYSLYCSNIISVPKSIFKLRRILKLINPDIVQTWMYHSDLLGGIVAKSLCIDNVIWGVRTTDVTLGRSKLTPILRKLCALLSYSVPKAIVCASDAGRKVHEQVDYDSRKTQVIHNGFELDKLKATIIERKELRKKLKFSDDELVVGSVGRYNKIKNQETFIQAAALIVIKYPKVKFVIVGRDNTWENTELVKWIVQRGLQEKFSLLGERSDVPICLAAMDIFCLHSKTEGFPNVLGEAMAMMKPCVATDVGDSSLLLNDTGIIVCKENPIELANGIERLLSLTSKERNSMGEAAQKRIQTHFTMSQTKEKFENLYEKILTGL